jgi:peptidoglycan hydrolase-like protein with peptidoglycan-binding domain
MKMHLSIRQIATHAFVMCLFIPTVAVMPWAQGASIDPQLKVGDTGDDVKLLQARLNTTLVPAPNLAVDGTFGASTTAAVIKFQEEHSLAADGIVGTKTWRALFGVTVNDNVRVSASGLAKLRAILDDAGLATATVTSGVRTSGEQARAMYENIKATSVQAQKDLYGPNGDQVIDVFVANSAKPKDEVVALMDTKIVELGPPNVSKHCSNTHDVIDVAPSTIADRDKFEAALSKAKSEARISNFLVPPADPSYHIESLK